MNPNSRSQRRRTSPRSNIAAVSPTKSASQSPETGDLLARYIADLQEVRAHRSASLLPPLQAAWGGWLDQLPFDWIVTLTFAVQVHPEQARKRWLRWIRALEHHPARPVGIELIWARADEQQRRQVIHFHALIALVGSVSIVSASKLWERIGGGWAHIRRYQSGLGGAYYISKGGDVELSPVWFD
jgi:hypothetical protein